MDPNLYQAIAEGDLAFLQQSEFNFFLTTPLGNTALHVAVESKSTACVELILDKCPSLVHGGNSKGDTALHIAATRGLPNIVKILIDHDKLFKGEVSEQLVRIANKESDTALHQAVRNHHQDVVNLLLKSDSGFEYFANKAGETPLYLAAEAGLTYMVKRILDNCPSPAHGGPQGVNALHAAVLRDSSEIMELLLGKKPTYIKEATRTGKTPLHYAAHLGMEDRVVRLLESDSSIAYVSDQDGCTALHIASGKGYLGIVKAIIQIYPDSCDQVDNRGWNFLHFAVRHGKKDIINQAIESENILKSLLNKRDKEGNKPLQVLDIKGQKNSVGVNVARIKGILLETNAKKVYPPTWDERMKHTGTVINNDLVVAILIATVAFTAALTLPGGFKNDGPDEGIAILAKKASLRILIMSDTLAMLLSTYAIFLHYRSRLLNNERTDLITKYINRATKCIVFSMMAMLVTFMTALYAVLPNSGGLSIIVCVMCTFVIASYLWFVVSLELKLRKLRKSIPKL